MNVFRMWRGELGEKGADYRRICGDPKYSTALMSVPENFTSAFSFVPHCIFWFCCHAFSRGGSHNAHRPFLFI
jgi:hypothetical protein